VNRQITKVLADRFPTVPDAARHIRSGGFNNEDLVVAEIAGQYHKVFYMDHRDPRSSTLNKIGQWCYYRNDCFIMDDKRRLTSRSRVKTRAPIVNMIRVAVSDGMYRDYDISTICTSYYITNVVSHGDSVVRLNKPGDSGIYKVDSAGFRVKDVGRDYVLFRVRDIPGHFVLITFGKPASDRGACEFMLTYYDPEQDIHKGEVFVSHAAGFAIKPKEDPADAFQRAMRGV